MTVGTEYSCTTFLPGTRTQKNKNSESET